MKYFSNIHNRVRREHKVKHFFFRSNFLSFYVLCLIKCKENFKLQIFCYHNGRLNGFVYIRLLSDRIIGLFEAGL